MILYWPLPSVTAVRLPPIIAGLAASTVTPGSTPPEVSFTTPAITLPLWADAAAAAPSRPATASSHALAIGRLPRLDGVRSVERSRAEYCETFASIIPSGQSGENLRSRRVPGHYK